MFYLDNILIGGKDWPDLKEKLILVLGALRKAKLTLNLAKCSFILEKVKFLGFMIDKDGISSTESKVNAILEYPAPTNVHELRRFLGLARFLKRFIHKFASVADPLYALLKDNTEFV